MTTTDASSAEPVSDPLALSGKPHDAYTFEQLADAYNFQTNTGWVGLSARLFRDECMRHDRPRKVLDIGCGKGIGLRPELTAGVRQGVDEFWGIEPDESITPAEGMFDHFQHALLEDADLPENYFDVSYSFLVVEHVVNPQAYMRAVARCLRPGGTHIFVTVNRAHYFAKIALLMKLVRMDEMVLRMVRGGDKVDEYHYPVQYKLNHSKSIDKVAFECGFEQPEHVFLEVEGPIGYFPGPLRPIYHLLNYKRKVMQNPRSLLTLVTRMRKAGG